MKFCYNTNFTLPKQSQRSRSVLQDCFGRKKTPSYIQRNTVSHTVITNSVGTVFFAEKL